MLEPHVTTQCPCCYAIPGATCNTPGRQNHTARVLLALDEADAVAKDGFARWLDIEGGKR